MYTFDMDGIADEEVKNTLMSRAYSWLFGSASSVDEQNSDLSFMVQPNPFSGTAAVHFTMNDATEQSVTLNLIDMLGRVVQTSGPIKIAQGMNSYALQNAGLNPGAYRLTLTGSNGSMRSIPVMINR
jgi:penicillin V acylase-like amidase (Ntn superfamily)